MKILLTCLFVFLTSVLYAQDTPVKDSAEVVFTFVEEMPEFPGGQKAMFTYLSTNIVYAEDAIKEKISGKVYVNFVVDKTGKVRDAKIIRGLYPSLDEEALRVVSAMPAWTPGKQNGKQVNVSYNLPVNFALK